jgi:hypothetical protein
MDTTIDQERGQVIAIIRQSQCNTLVYVLTSLILGTILWIALITVLNVAGLHQPPYLPLLLVLLLLSAWLNWRTRIVIRERGLEIHELGQDLIWLFPSLYADWTNLSHFKVEATRGKGPTVYVDMLHLKDCDDGADLSSIIRLKDLTYTTGRWFSQRTYRIIDPDDLAQSELGHYLLQYAPQVIETARQDKAQLEAFVAESA